MPSSDYDGPMLAPFWDDLYPSGGNPPVVTELRGAAPNRQRIIQWTEIPFCCSGPPFHTLHAVLNENGTVQFNYLGVEPDFQDTTSGIQKDSSLGLSYQANNEARITSNSSAYLRHLRT